MVSMRIRVKILAIIANTYIMRLLLSDYIRVKLSN